MDIQHRFNWTRGVLSWAMLNIAWLIAYILWRPWIRVTPFDKLPIRGQLIIFSTHRSLLDSFLLGAALYRWRMLLFRPRLVPWNVPEIKNYYYSPVLQFVMHHLHAVPIERGNVQRSSQQLYQLRNIIKQGGNIVIFPTGGRERANQPLHIQPDVIRFLQLMPRSTRMSGPDLLGVRINGLPVWKGSTMSTGTSWQKTKQFFGAIQQVLLRRVEVQVTSLTSCLQAVQQDHSQAMLAKVQDLVAEAIQPVYPANPP